METNTDLRENLNYNPSGKLLLSGFALFCCFVLSPLLGTLMLSWNISLVFAYSFVIFCTNILPLILIAFSFRNTSPLKCIIVVVLATGVFRLIAEIILSPVPFDLVRTPAYLVIIVLYSVLLSFIAVGVSLFNERKRLSVGIIVTGIILYSLFIREAFFTGISLLSGG